MTDTMLSLVPQAQAPQKAAQGSSRAAAEAKQGDMDHGFKGVLKSRMTAESKSSDAVEKDAKAQSTSADAAESVDEASLDDGKALPQTGNSTAEATAAAAPEGQTPVVALEELDAQFNLLALAGLETEAPALEDVGAQGVAETLPENLLEMLQAQIQPDNRARPPLPAAALSGRSELPNTAQVAIAQAVREAMAAVNASPLSESQQLDAQLRTAPALTGSTGLEAMTARLLMADSASATPLHMTTPGAQTVLSQDPLASARSALPTATLDTPLRQPGWGQALSERVLWVVNQKFQGVELKLNPAHLGPIEVRVQMQNDQAQVSFVAQHGPVREALEAALPRLREMFNANGFNLVDVNVSQHSFAEQQRQAHASERRGQGDFAGENEADLGDIPHPDRVRLGAAALGGVDLFA